MSFKPRTLANGRVCCTSPTALCEKCKAYFAMESSAAPPDSYATGLATLRAANAVEMADITPEERAMLGGYADGIARLRAANRV